MVLCYTIVIHQGTHQYRTKILQLLRKTKLNVRTVLLIGNWQSSASNPIGFHPKPRTLEQQEAYKKNISEGKSIELKIQELDSLV